MCECEELKQSLQIKRSIHFHQFDLYLIEWLGRERLRLWQRVGKSQSGR